MSTLKVDSLVEKTSGNGVHIAGHVIQVVNAVTTTLFNTTSSSYVDMNLQASITPLSASSKILVVSNINVGIYASSYLAYPKFKILRGSTTLSDTERTYVGRADQVGNFQQSAQLGWSYLDSPSTTSLTTYKLQMRNDTSYGAILYVQDKYDITLMEIAQ
jgi:hypothetical protein